jgi:hypothetical protein
MHASQFPLLADQVRLLPPAGAARDLRLFRLIDRSAAAEAAASLRSAAKAAPRGPLADVLDAAARVWHGGREDQDLVDADVEARLALRQAVADPAFLATLPTWISELRAIAATRPETGACTLATALQLWSWTLDHFRKGDASRMDAGAHATGDLIDACCPLIAARAFVIQTASPQGDAAARELGTNLCHVHVAHAAAATGALCAELVFGYRRHLVWDKEGCAACYGADEVDELEGFMPGIAGSARALGEVVETDGSHAAKAGPCVRFDGVHAFERLRERLDGCLSGARLARERVAALVGNGVSGPAKAAAAPGGR